MPDRDLRPVRARAVLPLVVVAATLIAGCGTVNLDSEDLEGEIIDAAAAQNPELPPIDSVSCPAEINSEQGTIVECTLEIGGESIPAEVELTDDEGGFVFSVPVEAQIQLSGDPGSDAAPALIARKSLERAIIRAIRRLPGNDGDRTIANPNSVDCPDGITAEEGTKFDCQAFGPGGPATVSVTLTDDQGGFRFSVGNDEQD